MKGGYGIGLWKCYKKGEGGGGGTFSSVEHPYACLFQFYML